MIIKVHAVRTVAISDQRRETMKRKRDALAVLLTCSLLLTCAAMDAPSQEVPRMSIEELKEKLGQADLVVVDVRADGNWAESKIKIQGAVREEPGKVNDWLSNYPKEKTLVFYCA
jgi:hypothetical protein